MKTDSRVEALRRRVEQERAASNGGRPRYSAELRRSVCALVEEPAWGVHRVSVALRLAPSVVYRCLRLASDKRSLEVSSARHAKLKRVTVVTEAEHTKQGFELVFPSGIKLVGLSWQDVSSLVRGDQ